MFLLNSWFSNSLLLAKLKIYLIELSGDDDSSKSGVLASMLLNPGGKGRYLKRNKKK